MEPATSEGPDLGATFEVLRNGVSLSLRFSPAPQTVELTISRGGENLYGLRGAIVENITRTTFMGQDLLKLSLKGVGVAWIRLEPEIGVGHDCAKR